MLSDINFIFAQGGLGQQLPGTDYYSGQLFWCADNALPSGFSTTDRIKKVGQIQDAEALGITNDYADETQATATYLVTNAGATGDKAIFSVNEPNGLVVELGTYTRSSTDTTAALVATAIAAVINAQTPTTGYSATVSTATVTIIARKGLGIFLNSGSPLGVTITGTVAGTITQFSGGVYSKRAIWHYHIDRFFKMQTNNQGILWIMINTTPVSTPTFSEIQTLQTYTNGLIKQMGIWFDFTAYASSHFATIQSVCNTLDGLSMPVDTVVYSADMSATTVEAITLNLGSLNDKNVNVNIAQDGAATGASLYTTTGKSIGSVGAELGTIAAGAVSQSIAEVGAFNVSDGTEFDTPAFATGQLVRNVSTTVQNTLDSYQYTFLRKFAGTVTITGTYWNNEKVAISPTSDYNRISRNRTVNKAKRGVREALLPRLASRIYLNRDGTLQATDIASLVTVAETPLSQMQSDGDLSGNDAAGERGYQVSIDPTQDILATNILYVTIKLIPVGIADGITVTIGFVPKL